MTTMLQGIGAAEVVPDGEGVQGSGAHQRGCRGRLGVEVAPYRPGSPSPKCATGSISQRYPDPPSMMRRWAPLRRVNSTTLAPRAKAPKRVRGMTRSQLLLVPWEGAGRLSRERWKGWGQCEDPLLDSPGCP